MILRCTTTSSSSNTLLPPSICLLLVYLYCCSSDVAVAAAAEKSKPNTNTATTKKRNRNKNKNLAAIQTKIVGGTRVTDKFKYPFFAELADSKCGASLIHDDILLTAAHCEDRSSPFDSRAFLLGLQSETGILRTIEKQVAHPLYEGELKDFDYMVMKLHTSALVQEPEQDSTPIPTGAKVIGLNGQRNVPQTGDPLLAVGFGKLEQEATNTANELHQVEIQYVSDEQCLEQYGVMNFLEEVMFCAGVDGGGKDTCQGDSGGPIIDKASGLQVGIVSFGIGCADEDYAGVNARVSGAIDWIENMICELSDYPPERCGITSARNVMPTGFGALTVYILYDNYPQEVAWRITHQDSDTQFYFQPYEEVTAVSRQISYPFENLPAGRYIVEFGDDQADGICCLYGRGSLAISDSDTAIWRHRGDYGIYLKVVFDMDTQGNLVFVTETSNYEASWEAYDAPNSPPSIDPDWPGAMPTANRNAVMINVKFDAYPGETTWQFQSYTLGEWRTIKSFSGVEDGVHNELVSVEVEAISEGWYRYAIQDSQNDGICCRYRRGWISITGPIITTQAQGLVWGNNGEFGSSFDVYIRMNSDGFLDRVSYTDPMATSATTRGHTDYNDRRQLRKAQLRKWQ